MRAAGSSTCRGARRNSSALRGAGRRRCASRSSPTRAVSSRSPCSRPGRTRGRPVRLPHEVAALPVPEQSKVRPTVTQQQVRATAMFIQAGAFSNFDNASRLSLKLARYGRTAVTPVVVNGQQLYRVRLGPVASVKEADNILDSIAGDAPQARIVVD